MKIYTQSPLPFQGQKKRFLKKFRNALADFPKDAVYVDLFGGSGLLAHTVKTSYPKATVIWNDFDDFQKRMNRIPETNYLLKQLREKLAPLPRDKKISGKPREELVQYLKQFEKQFGYLDFVTLSASLLFGGNYATNLEDFISKTFYNRIRLNDYQAEGYLDGVEREQDDYKNIHKKYQGKNTVFLVDPPYLTTDTSSYKKTDYWRLVDYLDIMNVLDDSSYFYFTSNKSQIVELCEWLETRSFTGNPFQGSTMTTTNNVLNFQTSYTDIMLYKKASE